MKAATLGLGINVTQIVCRFRAPQTVLWLPFAEVTTGFDEPTLLIHSARTGRGLINKDGDQQGLMFDQKLTVFQLMHQEKYSLRLNSADEVEMTVLRISESLLSLLMGTNTAKTLLKKLLIDQSPAAHSRLIPPYITASLHASLTDHSTESLHMLHTQAKVLEFLAALAAYVTTGTKYKPWSRKTLIVEQLHDELIILEGRIPTLNELAGRYGISARTLNDAFKQRYGLPIHSFVTDHRLGQAHTALSQSEIAMKVLANHLGYSHVNHFISAFTKKYGYSPGSLRR